jgi:hypothetical protein
VSRFTPARIRREWSIFLTVIGRVFSQLCCVCSNRGRFTGLCRSRLDGKEDSEGSGTIRFISDKRNYSGRNQNKSRWGMAFRFDFLEIGESDFTMVAERMLPGDHRSLADPANSRWT